MNNLFVRDLPGADRITIDEKVHCNPNFVSSICYTHAQAHGVNHLPRSRIGIKKAGFFDKLFGRATLLTFAAGQSAFKDNKVWVNTNSLKKFIFEWSGHAEFFNNTSLQLQKGATWKGYQDLKISLNFGLLNKSAVKKAQDVAYSVFKDYYKPAQSGEKSLNGSSLIAYASDALQKLQSFAHQNPQTLETKRTAFQHVFNKYGPIAYRCKDIPGALKTYFTIDSYLDSTHSWSAIFGSIKNPKEEESAKLVAGLDEAAPSSSRRSSNASAKSEDSSSRRSSNASTENVTKETTAAFTTKEILGAATVAGITGILAGGPAGAAVAAGMYLVAPKVTEIAQSTCTVVKNTANAVYDFAMYHLFLKSYKS